MIPITQPRLEPQFWLPVLDILIWVLVFGYGYPYYPYYDPFYYGGYNDCSSIMVTDIHTTNTDIPITDTLSSYWHGIHDGYNDGYYDDHRRYITVPARLLNAAVHRPLGICRIQYFT